MCCVGWCRLGQPAWIRSASRWASAGGNLTVALALSSRDSNGPSIAHLSIYYPFTDTTLSSTDWDTMDMPGGEPGRG